MPECVVPHALLHRVLQLLDHYAELDRPAVTEDDDSLSPRYWRRQAGTAFDEIERVMAAENG